MTKSEIEVGQKWVDKSSHLVFKIETFFYHGKNVPFHLLSNANICGYQTTERFLTNFELIPSTEQELINKICDILELSYKAETDYNLQAFFGDGWLLECNDGNWEFSSQEETETYFNINKLSQAKPYLDELSKIRKVKK